ncbi:NAD(P)-dependent alcohol dehydrogenase [Streptomyces mayteni]
MKAIVQDVYGPADTVLTLRDVPQPVPGKGEVLLRVRAAGVDPSVWHLTNGLPRVARLAIGVRRPRNPVPGWDGAGVVERVGPDVTGIGPGDEVFGNCAGSYAEFTLAKADRVVPKPTGLGFEEAAALPVSGVTVLQALTGSARPEPGSSVLVIGASGGVGTYAVQLAAAWGARVTGVSGPDAVDHVRGQGADDVIDYTRHEITDEGRRWDVIVDNAGNRPLGLLRRALTPRGTLVIVGGERGGRWFGGLDRNLRATLLSPAVPQKLRALTAVTRRADLLRVAELAGEGVLRPVIDRTYPLAEAAAAIGHLRNGHPRGKIVLTV